MKPDQNHSHAEQNQAPRAALLGLIGPSFRENWPRLLLGFLALTAVDFLQLLTPRILKHGVDALAATTASESLLLRLAGLLLLVALIIGVLRYCWRFLIVGFSRLLENSLRTRIFDHLLRLDAPFFERRTVGDLMAHSTNDLAAIQLACGIGLVAAIDALVMSTAAIGFMLYIHPQLTVLALLPMPLLVIGTRVLSSRLHRRFTSVQELFSQLTEFSRTSIVSIRLIKAYTMEALQSRRFDQLGRQYVRGNLKVAAIHGLMFPIATLVGNLGMLLVLLFGGRLAVQQIITLGDFVAFISYLYMLIWPMMAIGWVSSLVQRGLSSLNRIYQLLTSKPALPEITARPLSPSGPPTFYLQNLSFTYPQGSQPALKELTVTFAPGLHGITGRTGSGKSTLCRLLVRLYPLADGMLSFAGREINQLPVPWLREQIGYVGQEPVLFSDTIAANIALGSPQASPQEIEAVARLAAVHEDIRAFPDGYQTLIGERGVRLSGGQKQRLALARALLCNRPVLLIDDGLSAVDVTTEHHIITGLQQHLAGKTVLIVSNRLKLLSTTSRILVLDEGRLAAIGSHQQLLASNRLYQTMYDKQMRQQESEAQP